MLQSLSLESRQRIDNSDSTKFYERRVVVESGSINPVTLCTLITLSNTEILRVWIPSSIIFLNWPRPTDPNGFQKEHGLLKWILFESNSCLTRIESKTFPSSSLESILIPSNVEILGSRCFSYCGSFSSMTFESNSHLTRIESFAFSFSSLQSIVIPRTVEILGSKCFSNCK
jgi:hypothetical protein